MRGTSTPPGEQPDSLLGATLDGRWKVLRPLGDGATSVVYLVRQTSLGHEAALKLLHEEFTNNDEFVRRFAREARVLSKLQHIHCTSILDVGEYKDRPYIVMELVPGHLLSEEIGGAAMTPARAVGLMRQVLVGLRHAHGHGIVHRDLKPANLMVTEFGGAEEAIKILDFGFAHINDSRHSQSNADILPGTPSYMSPEQVQGIKTDPRTDLYATGVILYELCVGVKPFISADPYTLLQKHVREAPAPPRRAAPDHGISEPLEAVILQALAKSPDARFPDALAFEQALAALPEARPSTRPAEVSGGRRRTRRLAFALTLVAGIGLAAVAIGARLHLGRRTRPSAIVSPAASPVPPAAPLPPVQAATVPRVAAGPEAPAPEPERTPQQRPARRSHHRQHR